MCLILLYTKENGSKLFHTVLLMHTYSNLCIFFSGCLPTPPPGSGALHQQCGRPGQQLKSPLPLSSYPPPAFWHAAMLERVSLMPQQSWHYALTAQPPPQPSRTTPLDCRVLMALNQVTPLLTCSSLTINFKPC